MNNLLSNAIKFIQEGSIIVTADYLDEQSLQVRVIDTGPGMSKEDSEKLFKPFVQVGKQAGKQGTGLGLSICKKILEFMGGDISVDSQLGDGTTFTFTIDAKKKSDKPFCSRFSFGLIKVGLFNLPPILTDMLTKFLTMRGISTELVISEEKAQAYDAIIGNETFFSGTSSQNSEPSFYLARNKGNQFGERYQIHVPLLQCEFYNQLAKCFGEKQLHQACQSECTRSFANLRILVVDDDPMNRQVIKKLLLRHSVELKTASDGREAIDAWQGDHDFDLILMDCSMPVMDGFIATKKLRELECSVPIIALTAHAFEQHRDDCKSAGMNGFLTKPINIPELQKILEDAHKRKVNSPDQLGSSKQTH